MQFLIKIVNFYIFSNIHVALAGFCMTKITLLKFSFSSNLAPLFVALSIIVSYNFIRFYEIKTNRLSWMKKWFVEYQEKLFYLSTISISGLIYILFFTDFNLKSLIVLFPFAFMTFFYVVPLFKIGNYEVSFRNFPGIKIFSIAIAWAGISVLFPLYEEGFHYNPSVFIEFLQRILILIVITIPFDIRDVASDSKELKTLPLILGVRNVKWLGTCFLFLYVLLDFFNNQSSIITVIIAIITGLFLWNSSSKSTRFYTSFWVESIPIFWFILIILFLKTN